MYTHCIEAKDIPEAWFKCIYDIFDDERALADVWRIDKGSFAGRLRREFKSVLIEIENPCNPDLWKRVPMIPEGKCIPNPIDPVIYPELKCEICEGSIKNFKMLNHEFLATPCNHLVSKEFYERYRPTCEQSVVKYYAEYLWGSELSKNEQYTYGSRIMEPVVVPLKIKNEENKLVSNSIAEDLKENFDNYIVGDELCIAMLAQRLGMPLDIEKYNIVVPQYYYLCSYLRTNPKSNQIIIQIGKSSDGPLPDPPCLRHMDMQVKDGKLNWFIYFRSWDLWGGFPKNLCGFSMLMDQMCVDTGLEPGMFICHSKGLHLYEHSWSSALARLGR